MNTATAMMVEDNPAPAALGDDAAHILVVDDDARIRDLLSRYLGENGFRVSVASDAADARRKLIGLAFDLLIVDVMMPGESGTELTQTLREKMDVPVLMLTARSETESRITGLQAGADDYVPKPFDPRELLLRINNILRRSMQPESPAVEQVVFGPFTFTIASRELKKAGVPVRLTDREREIMVQFAQNAGETVPRLDLLGDDTATSERTVDVQINRLRRKIEIDPAAPTWLQTVRGIGYRLCLD
ncbi:MAG: response regulator transcription factor [Pseudomonadota bacterium]